jgi:UDP-GlcNAc:undecaprenyl-phosphate GlcNAc-1-phosphate transferase
MTAVYSFLLALMLAASLVPLLARVAPSLGLMDRPSARKIHPEPVPRVGGIAILIGVLVAMAVWVPATPELGGYVVGAGVIGVFGVLDDRLDLDYRMKFAAQIIAVLIFICCGGVAITRIPFTDAVLPLWASVPLTVVAIVGVTNSMNMADGLDGLAGGMTLLATAALGYLAYLGGGKAVALMAICLVGATLGFLRYNTNPARVFLGDAGSQFLGFSVAVLAILLVERANTVLSPLAPLLILAIPVLDTLVVMGGRMVAGVSPFKPDRTHLHHRLLDRGLTQYEAVVAIYVLQVGLSLLAWAFGYWSDGMLFGIFLALALLLFGGVHLAEVRDLRWPHHTIGRGIEVVRGCRAEAGGVGGLLARLGGLGGLGERLLLLAVPGFFLFASLVVERVPADIGWLALILLNALVAAMVFPWVPLGPVERLAAFVTAVTTSLMVEASGGLGQEGRRYLHLFFGLVAVAIGLRLRFADRRDFQVNTLDFLIVILVIVVPNLPVVRETGYGIVAIEALILFYACDLLIVERAKRQLDLLRVGLLGALGIFAVRGVWP